MELLALPAVLGWSLLLSWSVPDRSGTAIFAAVSAVAVALYAFALLGLLFFGAKLLFWLGIALLPGLLAADRTASLRFLLSVPSGAFVLLAALQWWLFSDAAYVFWDEFSQWGLVTREMIATGELFGPESNARRPTAPPIAALWHVFVCANTRYSESGTHFAQFLMVSAALLPLADGLSPRRPGWIVLAAAVALVGLANLGHGFVGVRVDPLLGAGFAGVLLAHAANPGCRRTLALLSAPLFALALTKETGVFLAGAASLFVAASFLSTLAEQPAMALRRLRRDRRAATALCALLLAAPLALASWQAHLIGTFGDSGARSVWGVGARVAQGPATPADGTLAPRFAELLTALPMSRSPATERYSAFSYPLLEIYAQHRRLAIAGWLAFFALASAVAWWSARARARRRLIVLLSLFLLAVFGAYVFSLYRVYESSPDGERFSSFIRYVNTLLLPMVIVSLSWFLPTPEADGSDAGARRPALALTTLLAVLFIVEPPYAAPLFQSPQMHAYRRTIRPAAEQITGSLDASSRLLVVGAPEDRFRRWMLAYEITPVPVTLRVGDISETEAVGGLARYDFVWFLRPPSEWTQGMAAALGPRRPDPRVIYRVDRLASGHALLPHLELREGGGSS